MTSAFLPSYTLSVPRLLLQFITGRHTIGRGGVLLCSSANPTALQSPELNFKTSHKGGAIGPYDGIDSAYWELVKDLEVFQLPTSWTQKEAAGLFEMLQATRQLRTSLSDRSFLEKYIETGGRGVHLVSALKETMAFA
jgi:small subunit ribosomal protein S29